MTAGPNADFQRIWAGQPAVAADGRMVGHVLQIFVGGGDAKPRWALVSTNMFTGDRSFVPLAGAHVEGSTLVLGYDKDLINRAPCISNTGELTDEDERLLGEHYCYSHSGPQGDGGTKAGLDLRAELDLRERPG